MTIPKHYWTIACKSAAIDQITNNIILGQTVEEVHFEIPKDMHSQFLTTLKKDGYVALPYEFFIISYLEQSPDTEGNIKIVYNFPNGKKETIAEASVNYGANGRGRHILKMPGLKFNDQGRYNLQVISVEDKKEQELIEIPIFIKYSFI